MGARTRQSAIILSFIGLLGLASIMVFVMTSVLESQKVARNDPMFRKKEVNIVGRIPDQFVMRCLPCANNIILGKPFNY